MQNHPAAFKFSLCMEYGKKRSFQLSWLKDHKWLVYSPKEDGACHRECAFLGTASLKNSDEIDELVKSPITCWTTTSQKFKSPMHTLSAESFVKIMHYQSARPQQ